MNETKSILSATVEECHLWTDSMIVRWWLRKQPTKLSVYVRNRVSNIQQLTKEDTWHHVPTADNPADLASRGCIAS